MVRQVGVPAQTGGERVEARSRGQTTAKDRAAQTKKRTRDAHDGDGRSEGQKSEGVGRGSRSGKARERAGGG